MQTFLVLEPNGKEKGISDPLGKEKRVIKKIFFWEYICVEMYISNPCQYG